MDLRVFLIDFSLALSCGLGVGITGYLLVSFWMMLPHTEPRPRLALVREMMRELFWVLLTQPIAPLWYFIGRKMGRGTGQVPVVFVHGYMQNRIDFVWIARTLRRAKVGPMFGFNYPWMASIKSNAARLARFVERVCRETGAERVDLVCHSMGGVVALEAMLLDGHRVRRCVTIASPHGGVMWKGPMLGVGAEELRRGSKYLAAASAASCAVPTLSIYSTHDNIVHPPTTSALAHRGGVDIVVEGLGHFAILFSSRVGAEVATFLEASASAPREEAPEPRASATAE